MDKNEAIEKVREYKKLLSTKMNVEQVYLFGSYAKENFREDSDIDVAIVVSNLSGDFFEVNPMLWKLRREIDDRIEPVIIDRNYDQSGFLNEIKKEGIEIK
jgi:predicted nucleotidyltransferase